MGHERSHQNHVIRHCRVVTLVRFNFKSLGIEQIEISVTPTPCDILKHHGGSIQPEVAIATLGGSYLVGGAGLDCMKQPAIHCETVHKHHVGECTIAGSGQCLGPPHSARTIPNVVCVPH
jgi:hypothetical protein